MTMNRVARLARRLNDQDEYRPLISLDWWQNSLDKRSKIIIIC